MFSSLFSTLFAPISGAKPTPYSGEKGSLFRMEMIRSVASDRHDLCCLGAGRVTILSLSKGSPHRRFAHIAEDGMAHDVDHEKFAAGILMTVQNISVLMTWSFKCH